MSANKKPRKAYRQRPVLVTPLPFCSSAYMLRAIGLRVRSEVDAVVSHDAQPQHVHALSAEIVSLSAAIDIARANPGHCQVDPEALEQAGEEVHRIAHSIASVMQRMEQTGKIGCSGTERADILQLADIYEQLLTALPRRMWHDAYERAIQQPEMRVAA
jgi:hypothetical protein